MSVYAIREQKHTRLIFDGALTIYEASAVRAELSKIVIDPRPLEIDLTGISEIDLSGVQLLLTLLHEPSLTFLPGSNAALDNALLLLDLRQLFWPQPQSPQLQAEH
jgi:ABC-type transporter Mla MlaB component